MPIDRRRSSSMGDGAAVSASIGDELLSQSARAGRPTTAAARARVRGSLPRILSVRHDGDAGHSARARRARSPTHACSRRKQPARAYFASAYDMLRGARPQRWVYLPWSPRPRGQSPPASGRGRLSAGDLLLPREHQRHCLRARREYEHPGPQCRSDSRADVADLRQRRRGGAGRAAGRRRPATIGGELAPNLTAGRRIQRRFAARWRPHLRRLRAIARNS